MNMIGHQAIGVDLYAKCILKLTQVREVALIILGDGKHHLTVMTALYDMVWVIRYNNTSHPGHT